MRVLGTIVLGLIIYKLLISASLITGSPFSLSRVTDLFPVSSSWLQVYNLLFTDLILDLLSIGGRASFLHRASCCWASTYEWREMTSDSCFWFVPLWSGSRVPHSWFPCLKNQADTKDLTSSSKFSGSCVHTLQTHPPYDLEHASLRSVHTTRWLVDTRGERGSTRRKEQTFGIHPVTMGRRVKRTNDELWFYGHVEEQLGFYDHSFTFAFGNLWSRDYILLNLIWSLGLHWS